MQRHSFLGELLTNSSLSDNVTVGLSDLLDSGEADRNCSGMTVLELQIGGVHAFTETLTLDIGGSPSTFDVSLLAPPNATQASLTSSGLALEIQFDSLTNRARMGSNILPCTEILRAVHVPCAASLAASLQPANVFIAFSTR
jgi:hypothetical protein